MMTRSAAFCRLASSPRALLYARSTKFNELLPPGCITFRNSRYEIETLTFRPAACKVRHYTFQGDRMNWITSPTGVAGRHATIKIDDDTVEAEEGEPVAAVLLRHAPFTSRTTPVSGQPRAPFCMMGVCFDCLVEIDGQTSVRSCMAQVRAGMAVRRQRERPDPVGGQQP